MGKKRPKSKAPRSAAAVSEPPSMSDISLLAGKISTINQAVFLKVCRLCESKDGPFLNIFDAEKVTAKKIDELMPFKILENDDLPHKICFRCSAKVEELHEFIQKCIRTQESLHTALGKKDTLVTKTKTRTIWEENLNKNNISNDDICDALIKKAMEGIKDIPLNPVPFDDDVSLASLKKQSKTKTNNDKTETAAVPVKKESNSNAHVKSNPDSDSFDKKFLPTRTSRSQNPEGLLDGLPDYKRTSKKASKTNDKETNSIVQETTTKVKAKVIVSSEGENSSDTDDVPLKENKKEEKTETKETKPFNIMDHISIIKVNGVGVLYQCKLCNRNFLKEEIVLAHGCAKSGGAPKIDFPKSIAPPEPPKPSVVKYINTKIDGELGRPIETKTKSEEVEKKVVSGGKPKPRIGPASKVKRKENDSVIGMKVVPIEEPAAKQPPPVTPPVSAPSVQFPSVPSLNSRYKLVPGPNNTFHLVEEAPTNNTTEKDTVANTSSKSSRKRKNDESKQISSGKSGYDHRSKCDMIDLDDSESQTEKSGKNSNQPYPVGLFSTLHASTSHPATSVPTFTTPAMKKQSYTIVQTGNPSKLLISTKPQPPVEEPSKKRQKKSKESRTDGETDKQPFRVTLEDAVPPAKDSFFTFINVDPLLQPSYVLPTDNIIQESQISTSTSGPKENTDGNNKYSCNMCEEKFSREKKLLAHIHSHYTKMDEEDMIREKSNKKRSRK